MSYFSVHAHPNLALTITICWARHRWRWEKNRSFVVWLKQPLQSSPNKSKNVLQNCLYLHSFNTLKRWINTWQSTYKCRMCLCVVECFSLQFILWDLPWPLGLSASVNCYEQPVFQLQGGYCHFNHTQKQTHPNAACSPWLDRFHIFCEVHPRLTCDHPMDRKGEREREREIERHCVKQAKIPVILKPQILSPLRIKKNVLSCPPQGHSERKDDKAKSDQDYGCIPDHTVWF